MLCGSTHRQFSYLSVWLVQLFSLADTVWQCFTSPVFQDGVVDTDSLKRNPPPS